MSTDAKERIRERLDIIDVVGEVVALKPAGRGQLKGLCPFHNEKTPSFHVHQDRGFFYCFGCQAKGDIFDFVMRSQSVEFFDALQLLGTRAGIEVTPQAPQASKRRDLFELNTMALAFFRSQLPGPGFDYLKRRELSQESIDTFELGYAPDTWDALLKHALAHGLREDDLLDAGLLAENSSGRRYDRFRNRVVFPIKDYLGRVVGFSGRVLDDSLPKYLNTPETELFKKAELLYGLDLAKGPIRATGECLVVEGYMDVIALHQTGFSNAVAALGANVTAEQASLLSRFDVHRLFLAFDADEAGQRAVLSALEQSVGRQFLVRAVTIPTGKDPADAVLGGGVEAFRQALKAGQSEVEFRFGSVLEKHDRESIEGKKAILSELLPALRPRDLFDPVASEMRRLVIDHLKIDGSRLDEWINSKRQRRLDATQVKGMERRLGAPSQIAVIELEIIALMLMEPGLLRKRLRALESALPPEVDDSVLREFHAICEQAGFDDQQILMRYRERDEGRILFERLFSYPLDEEVRIDIDGSILKMLSRLREHYLDNEKETQRAKLLERMQEVSQALIDPSLPAEQLTLYYSELKRLSAMLAARDAERRLRVPEGYGKNRRRGSF